MTKFKIFIFLTSFFIFSSVKAQLNYTFTSTTSTFNLLSGATTIFNGGSNNSISGTYNIGFPFEYGCNTYTQFRVCTEGWMGLGNSFSNESNNNLSGSNQRPVITALWDNIRVGNNGSISYTVTGTAPNRVFTMQWYRMRWQGNGNTTNNGAISFQVKLTETTNEIEFNYRQESGGLTNPSASIGLSGTANGDFYSVNPVTNTVSTVTETNNISSKPSNNRLYRFVPATSCIGTPTAGTASTSGWTTTCNSSYKTFTLTGGSSGCGILYQWQYSNDNTTWFDIPGANSTSFSDNILGTTYIRCVVTCSSTSLFSTSNVVTVNSTATPPTNDLPCNAIQLSLGAASSGNNTCSNDAFEPNDGTCWTNGNVNTVWYEIVAPASGSLRVKTIIQSGGSILQFTQIALYSGTCTSLNQVACDITAPACGGYTPSNSEIYVTGLTPGASYYLSVDGTYNNVGSFGVLAIDGASSFPSVQGQDCGFSYPICNQTTTIGNPGYQAIGGICDHVGFYGSGNCTGGEANSVWYTIKIDPLLTGTSTLTFDIVPNDYGDPNPITGAANPGYNNIGDETDYDFVLWKTSGTGASSCAAINSGFVSPAACNYDGRGVTGVSGNGNSPYFGFNQAYETGPTVSAGDEFTLVIQNYSNSTGGFTLQFPTITPVEYEFPTTVYWSGGNFDNSFTDFDNWGGCSAPICGVSAIISPSSSNQPELTAGIYSVDDITINAGSSLTIRSGVTLEVCGDFTNNGSLICDPGSTVNFVGTGTQTITGAFENSDAFHNLTITKLTGSVVLANNIDVNGDFLTASATSELNTAGLRVRVGGDFTNNDGDNTFSSTGATGTLGFIGTGAVNYDQGSSNLNLNFVTMTKTGGGTVTLDTDMRIKVNTGTLTLNNGIFVTNNRRIRVFNRDPAAVTTGNNNSYVNGNLWRRINGTGSYDFPVGTATLYERANITFTAATSINELRARFDTWAGTPNTIGVTDCAGTGNFILPAQDMGIWEIQAIGGVSTSGVYDVTLYSQGATNTAGATGWTVQKANAEAGPWTLNGNCAFSTVSVIQRTDLSGFSVFGVAQSTTPLPIELTTFSGFNINKMNVLQWTTASELNSDYFLVERSRDGINFSTMEQVPAMGNSYNPIDYDAVDQEPFEGISYYRLKFFDLDGTSDMSKTIAISNEIEKNLVIKSVFPNPGTNQLNMDYSVATDVDLDLYLMDGSGRILKTDKVSINGSGTYTMSTRDINSGIYFFVVNDNNGFKEVHSWVKK